MTFWPKKNNKTKQPVCNPDADCFAVFSKVSVEIGQRRILNDLSLSLSERRIGVIGLNGSGKSTFVRLLNGLRQADHGTLTLFDAPAADAEAELPRHVGFVFQNPDHQAIFPTVEEEIAFGLTQLGEDKNASRAQARAFLARHGCEALAGVPIAELSEGQKQLICILAVLVMEPRLLVLDEPMTSLDAVATGRLRTLLMSLPQKIVLVSHDLSHFEGFDRILWLEDGHLRMDGTPYDVLAAYREDIDRRLGSKPELVAL